MQTQDEKGGGVKMGACVCVVALSRKAQDANTCNSISTCLDKLLLMFVCARCAACLCGPYKMQHVRTRDIKDFGACQYTRSSTPMTIVRVKQRQLKEKNDSHLWDSKKIRCTDVECKKVATQWGFGNNRHHDNAADIVMVPQQHYLG